MSAHDRPLAISLLLGASGWVAGVFMLVFVAMLFHPDSAGQAAVSGCVLLAAAWGLFKVDRDGEQVFVAPVASAALLLQAVLALAMPNRLHRVLSTLFATIAWALTLRFALFGESDDWHGGSAAQAAPLPSALAGWVFAWVPVAAGLWWTIRNERAWMGGRWSRHVWLGTNAFFFEEGTAERFSKARYGEFRVDRASGEAVLVGLRNDRLEAL